MSNLTEKRCLPCEGFTAALTTEQLKPLLAKLDRSWKTNSEDKILSRNFVFKNYYQTMAFVNAIAWMAHHENHHPDLEVGYDHCLVRYTTHAIGGLSENDVICAAKVDTLFNAQQ